MTQGGISVSACRFIDLRGSYEDRGNLTVLESGVDFPFDIARVYYVYGVPEGTTRGAHGHKELSQLIIAVQGSFVIQLDDGQHKKSFTLNRPDQGLFVPPGLWRDLSRFKEGGMCMVLASHHYDADDYIHDYETYKAFAKARNGR